MLKRHRIFSFSYSLIFVFNIYAQAKSDVTLKLVAVPLIGMSLILYFLIHSKLKGSFNKFIFVGLVLAMAGDIQLLFTGGTEFFFLTAVIATSISYIMYLLAFFHDFKQNPLEDRKYGKLAFFISGLSSIVYYTILKDNLGDYKFPVMIHLFLLSLLPILSAYRYNRVNLLSFRFIFGASVLFLVSDYFIGYSSFVHHNIYFLHIYLGTYMLAQYLMVIGSIERKLKRKNRRKLNNLF